MWGFKSRGCLSGAGITPRAAERLFSSKLALTGNSLVGFGDALDPILKLTVSRGQLPGHNVAATGRAPVREAWSECNSLAGSKLVLCRRKAFQAHAYRPNMAGRAANSSSQCRRGDGVIVSQAVRMDRNRFGQPVFIPD